MPNASRTSVSVSIRLASTRFVIGVAFAIVGIAHAQSAKSPHASSTEHPKLEAGPRRHKPTSWCWPTTSRRRANASTPPRATSTVSAVWLLAAGADELAG